MLKFTKSKSGSGKPVLVVEGLGGKSRVFVSVEIQKKEAVAIGHHTEVRVAVQAAQVDAKGSPVLDSEGKPMVSALVRGAHHTDHSTAAEGLQIAIDIASRNAVNGLLGRINASKLAAADSDPLTGF